MMVTKTTVIREYIGYTGQIAIVLVSLYLLYSVRSCI